MDEHDDRSDPLVRALREDPLPDRPYWPGRFSQRLRNGEISRLTAAGPGRSPVRARTVTARAFAIVLVALAIVVGYLVVGGSARIAGPGSSAEPTGAPSPTPVASLGTTLRIGISLPLGPDVNSDGDAIRDGALLAIKDAMSSGLLPGYTIEAEVLDHSTNGGNDADKAQADMVAMVGDPTVVGVVGPLQSYVAKAQIPVANAAGLVQCTPSASNPNLTKGPQGQLLRVTNPDRVAFLRLAPTDDDVGPGIADFARQRLLAGKAFVVDDGGDYGVPLADAFAARFQTDGGVVLGRQSIAAEATNFGPAVAAIARLHPQIVMYGGVNAYNGDAQAGAGSLRRQMGVAGLGAIPLIGGDGLRNSDSAGASLIDEAGKAAAGTYSANLAPSDYAGRIAFEAAFQAAYGRPPSAYAGPGYACAQVILQALAAARTPSRVIWPPCRAAATAAGQTYETVLGPVRFDTAGDEIAPLLGMDAVDLKANGGKGAWVVLRSGASPP